MPFFQYSARSQNGEALNGTIESNSRQTAADTLLGRGIIPLKLEELDQTKSLFDKDISHLFVSRHVPIQELILFSRQMYSLTRAGVPLTRAINGLLQSSTSTLLKNVLDKVFHDLNAGTNLATALAKHPDIFSTLYISLIHVGENSGQLEESFKQIAAYLELEEKTRQRIKSSMRYPLFVIMAIVAAIVVINIFVIPQFSKLFASFNAGDLPLPTRMLMASSEFFLNYWVVILIASFAGFFSFSKYIKTNQGELWWDKFKLKIPIFGNILYRALLARFSRTFAMMSRSGVPLINALNIVSEVVDNKWVSFHIKEMRSGVENGESIKVVATRSKMFSPLVLQMIAVGEETGQLDEMLDEVAGFYEEQVDYDLKKLSDYIEPVLIVFIGAIVLILMLAVYLPMWDLTSKASGK
ncbi:MAG: type II secretion system F family protein [Gammaproteobacteria bacterium]|nr:type II secretion system F family protein [Gammaproteobacteria bacterium]MDH5628960.1 type II secretion system F family protein [Gammaproteobacteria bacterium]